MNVFLNPGHRQERRVFFFFLLSVAFFGLYDFCDLRQCANNATFLFNCCEEVIAFKQSNNNGTVSQEWMDVGHVGLYLVKKLILPLPSLWPPDGVRTRDGGLGLRP